MWEFTIEQDGIIVVSGTAPTVEEARAEGDHYAMMYAQDGRCTLTVREVQDDDEWEPASDPDW